MNAFDQGDNEGMYHSEVMWFRLDLDNLVFYYLCMILTTFILFYFIYTWNYAYKIKLNLFMHAGFRIRDLWIHGWGS